MTDYLILSLSVLLAAVLGFLLGRHGKGRSQDQARQAETEAAGLKAELQAQARATEEKLEFLKQNDREQIQRYQQLSAQVLEQTQESFFKLANERLSQHQQLSEKDLKSRHQAIAGLVSPLAENLEKVQARIQELEKHRTGAYEALKQQISDLKEGNSGLKQETSRLVQALKQPSGRGQWGEMQLRRVVELAGMIEHCDFETQVSANDADGRAQRPDLIVRLPSGRSIIVDSKAPMDAYLAAIDSQTEEERARHLSRHADQVATHLKQLGSKSYQNSFDETPEFVVLFLPSEALFAAALEQNPGLIEAAVKCEVIPATPTTLIALLRTVAQGWREESLAREAGEIAKLGSELHHRCATLAGHFNQLGRSVEKSVENFNKSVACLEGRVMVSARELQKWEAEGKKEIPSLKEIDPPAIRTIEVIDAKDYE